MPRMVMARERGRLRKVLLHSGGARFTTAAVGVLENGAASFLVALRSGNECGPGKPA